MREFVIDGNLIHDGQEVLVFDKISNLQYPACIVFHKSDQKTMYVCHNYAGRSGSKPTIMPPGYVYGWQVTYYISTRNINDFNVTLLSDNEIFYLDSKKRFINVLHKETLWICNKDKDKLITSSVEAVPACCGAYWLKLKTAKVNLINKEDFNDLIELVFKNTYGNVFSKSYASMNITAFLDKDLWSLLEDNPLFYKIGETSTKVLFINKETYERN